MSSSGMASGLFSAFLDWLYQSGEIKVPADYHSRCDFIAKMTDNDSSAMVNTILDYAINSASETDYHVESENKTLESLFNLWLDNVNININGVPMGLQHLAKEYFRERWAGSSLCLMRVSGWKELSLNSNSIVVPTVLWFVNGSSIYVKRPNEKNYQLGTDQYFLDANFKTELKSDKKEQVIIQKPYARWYEKYPVPYLVRKGVLKNYLTLKSLHEKVDEIVSKVLPYLFVIEKGTEAMAQQGITYTDPELQDFVEQFKHMLEKYKIEKGRTPANVIPFDQKYNHLIPDMLPVLKEDLYNEINRRILIGLGFVDVIQGISSTRKESIINPKPFITELNTGVEGFKDILMDVVNLIIDRNQATYPKLFADGKYLEIINAPLKINVEAILDIVRNQYDRGLISKRTFIESTGFDYETEKERRQKELKQGDEDLFYPPIIQNQERDTSSQEETRLGIKPSKDRKAENLDLEKQGKKKGSPEAKNFTNASMRVLCPKCQTEFPIRHENMKVGDVRCPSCSYEMTDLDVNDYIEKYVTAAKPRLKCKICNSEIDIIGVDLKVGHVRCNQCDKEYPNTDYMLIDFPGGQPYAIASKVEYIRVRIVHPDKFEADSFRTIWFSEKQGIKAIIGKKKGETSTTVQAVLFDKEKFTDKEAKSWVETHYGHINAYLTYALFDEAKVIGQPIDSNDVIWQEVNLEMAPYRAITDLPHNVQNHPKEAQQIFLKVFNTAWKAGKDETSCFKIAYSVMDRWLKKNK